MKMDTIQKNHLFFNSAEGWENSGGDIASVI